MSYIIFEEPLSKAVCCTTLSNSLKKQYLCQKCNYTFTKPYYLRLHMKSHAYVCSHCSKRFMHKSLLTDHIIEEHTFPKKKNTNRYFQCEKCKLNLNSKYEYKKHLLMFHRDKYVCTRYCGKEFKSRSQYCKHVKNHPVVSCAVCGKKVKFLITHMKTHLIKRYSCKLCDKHFPHISNLRRHMLLHLKIKPYLCTVCGKSFSQSYNLVVHTRHHAQEKLYKCQICHMSFVRSNALKLHETAVHQGKESRVYSCDKCQFRSVAKWRVNEHKKLFHREIYQCDICSTTLKCKTTLEAHMWTHSELKPFSCPHCIMKYVTKAALTKHLRNIHNKWSY